MASVRKKQRLIKKRTPYWSHRYAKPFIFQMLLRRAQAAMVIAVGISRVKQIRRDQSGKLDKAIAIAKVLTDTHIAVSKVMLAEPLISGH